MILELELTDELLAQWPQWRKKILAFAELEAKQRPPIKAILDEFKETNEHAVSDLSKESK